MNISSGQLEFRIAEKKDWNRVLEIYNEAVSEFGKTADLYEQDLDSKHDLLSLHLHIKYPILLGLINEKIIGWCSLSPYRKGRKALEFVAEISYYISGEYRNKGIGTSLIEKSIAHARDNGIRNLIAILLDINTESIRLLEKFKFKQWGHLPEIANIEDKICGQFIYGRNIENFTVRTE
jgi:phosphinothricin acetyltransferase